MEITRKEALALAKVLHYHPQGDKDSAHARAIGSLVARIDEYLAAPRDTETEPVQRNEASDKDVRRVGVWPRDLQRLPSIVTKKDRASVRFWPAASGNDMTVIDVLVDGVPVMKGARHLVRHEDELWASQSRDGDWMVIQVESFPWQWEAVLPLGAHATVGKLDRKSETSALARFKAWQAQEQSKIDKLKSKNDSLKDVKDVDGLLALTDAFVETDKLLSDDSYEIADYPRKGRGGNNRRHGRKR